MCARPRVCVCVCVSSAVGGWLTLKCFALRTSLKLQQCTWEELQLMRERERRRDGMRKGGRGRERERVMGKESERGKEKRKRE